MVDKVNLAMSFKIFDYQKKEERIFKRDSSMNFQEKLSVSLRLLCSNSSTFEVLTIQLNESSAANEKW